MIYEFNAEHPLSISIGLIRMSQTKPVYTISDLAKLWVKKNGKSYTVQRVRQILNEHDIKVYRMKRKGYYFLCDLRELVAQ
jgi:hypothetical protein